VAAERDAALELEEEVLPDGLNDFEALPVEPLGDVLTAARGSAST
jgi:hypothetical protein